ncbi:hypothetical protein H261_15737 [Paramagnetospirillum caucaseum]|uniref:Uncharacterized protein n=1 Tax=Paramagnetospirillum caucaseum TaxID=1244869 RepID=M2Z3N2_9PROT|nr:hypothetical protein H261_15737 [Paramagnetospirillum caucaseum]
MVRERVLAPVLWCLSCFRTRVEAVEAAPMTASRPVRPVDAGQPYRLAG